MAKPGYFCTPLIFNQLSRIKEIISDNKTRHAVEYLDFRRIVLAISFTFSGKNKEEYKANNAFFKYTGDILCKAGLIPLGIMKPVLYFAFNENTNKEEAIILARAIMMKFQQKQFKKGYIKIFKSLEPLEIKAALFEGNLTVSLLKLGRKRQSFIFGTAFDAVTESLTNTAPWMIAFPSSWQRENEDLLDLSTANGQLVFLTPRGEMAEKARKQISYKLDEIAGFLKEFSLPDFPGKQREFDAECNLEYFCFKGHFPVNSSIALKKSTWNQIFKEIDYLLSRIPDSIDYYYLINTKANSWFFELLVNSDHSRLPFIKESEINLPGFSIRDNFKINIITLGSYKKVNLIDSISDSADEVLSGVSVNDKILFIERADKEGADLIIKNGDAFRKRTLLVTEEKALDKEIAVENKDAEKAAKPKIIIYTPQQKTRIAYPSTREVFAGREQEKKILAKALNEQFAFVEITGEAGIGKTTLIKEFSRNANANLFYGSGQSRHGNIPLFADILNNILAVKFPIEFSALEKAFFSYIGKAFSKTPDREKIIAKWTEIFPLFSESVWGVKSNKCFLDWPSEAVNKFIDDVFIDFIKNHGMTGNKKLLICIDDAHKLMISDKNRLKKIVSRLYNVQNEQSVCLVYISRSIDKLDDRIIKNWCFHHIDLGKLDANECKTIISSSRNKDKITTEIEKRLISFGNPVFIKLAECGILPERKDKIQDAVHEYLQKLGTEERKVISILSWSGNEWNLNHLKEIYKFNLKNIDEIKFFFSDLDIKEGSFAFRCLFLRDIIVSEIPKEDKIKLHAKWFDHLKILHQCSNWTSDLSLCFYHAFESRRYEEASELGMKLARLFQKDEQWNELVRVLRKLEMIPKPSRMLTFTISLFYLYYFLHQDSLQEIKRRINQLDKLVRNMKDKKEIIEYWLLKAEYSKRYESRILAQEMILELQRRVKRWKDEEIQASISFLIGSIAFKLGQYKLADKSLEEAFSYFKSYKDSSFLYKISHIYYKLNIEEKEFHKASEIAGDVINYANSANHFYSKSSWELKLAYVLYKTNDFNKAEQVLLNAKKYFQSFNIAYKWTNLLELEGDLYKSMENYRDARLTYEKALECLKYKEEHELELNLLIKYINLLAESGLIQRCHQVAETISRLAREKSSSIYVTESNLVLSGLYLSLGIYDKVKEVINQSAVFYQHNRRLIALARLHTGLSELYKGNTEYGFRELKHSVATAFTVEDMLLRFNCLIGICRYFIATKDWVNVVEILDKLKALIPPKWLKIKISYYQAQLEYLQILFHFQKYLTLKNKNDLDSALSILEVLFEHYNPPVEATVFDLKLNLLAYHIYDSMNDSKSSYHISSAYKIAENILIENKNEKIQLLLRSKTSFCQRVLDIFEKSNLNVGKSKQTEIFINSKNTKRDFFKQKKDKSNAKKHHKMVTHQNETKDNRNNVSLVSIHHEEKRQANVQSDPFQEEKPGFIPRIVKKKISKK
ncbi:MAG: ATP-binding protein [Candidatus Coatesbacteria bacterium]|nr:ATP-binding protein [Candidatus Coatesbacteria bacterium]